MARYIDLNQVKAMNESKVSFGNSDSQINDVELNILVNAAEAKVELDLFPYYVVPLKGQNPLTFEIIEFNELTNEPEAITTVEVIRSLCYYRSTYNLLKNFYGKTGNNRGDSYLSYVTDQYQDLLKPITEKRKTGVFNTPPLPWLYLNAKSQRVSPVAPSPQVTNPCHVNTLTYVNRHLTDPSSNWQIARLRGRK